MSPGPQKNVTPLSGWSCGVEGGWDNRGAGAGLALLSISVSSLTSPFLAREGTEKHSPCSSSPNSSPQAQHALCCWFLLGRVGVWACESTLQCGCGSRWVFLGTVAGSTLVSSLRFHRGEAHSHRLLTRAKKPMQCTSPGHESGAWDEHVSSKKQER